MGKYFCPNTKVDRLKGSITHNLEQLVLKVTSVQAVFFTY